MKKIETRISTMSFDGKVLLSIMNEDIVVDKEDVAGNFADVLKLVDGKKYVSLVITAQGNSITKEGREENEKADYWKLCIAQAIVVDSLPVRILGNFVIKMFKKYCPQKLFSNKKEALEWLEYHWQLANSESVSA